MSNEPTLLCIGEKRAELHANFPNHVGRSAVVAQPIFKFANYENVDLRQEQVAYVRFYVKLQLAPVVIQRAALESVQFAVLNPLPSRFTDSLARTVSNMDARAHVHFGDCRIGVCILLLRERLQPSIAADIEIVDHPSFFGDAILCLPCALAD